MIASDCYREYARILDLVKGTDVHPNDCLQLNGRIYSRSAYVLFDDEDEKTEFAITIVEGKPVFNNDILYCKNGHIWKMGSWWLMAFSSDKPVLSELSWCKPHIRKTVKILGLCDFSAKGYHEPGYDVTLVFNSEEDVKCAIAELQNAIGN